MMLWQKESDQAAVESIGRPDGDPATTAAGCREQWRETDEGGTTTVQPASDQWRDEAVDDLLDAIVALEDRSEAAGFMRDLCTLGELQAMAQRWHVVRLLNRGLHYQEVSRLTGASTGTITRVAAWLHHGTGGYALALERLAGRSGPSPRSGR